MKKEVNKLDKVMQFMISIEKKLDHISNDIHDVKDAIVRLEGRMEHLEIRMGSLETRVGSLETRMDNLETKVDNMTTEFRSHFVKIETELEQPRGAFKVYEMNVNDLKSGVYHLSSQMGIHDTRIKVMEERLKI